MDEKKESSATQPDGRGDTAAASVASGVLEYARDEMSALGRWAYRTFTRDNLVGAIKTLSWVTPLTILIWVYAEREHEYVTPSEVAIPISIKSVDPGRIVQLRQGDTNLMAVLAGPRQQVERVLEAILPRDDEPAVQIRLEGFYIPKKEFYTLQTERLLNESLIFKTHGVTVKSSKPANLEVFVDQIEERDVEVKIEPQVQNLNAFAFEPRTVKLRGPRRLFEDKTPQVYAKLLGREELQIPGQHELSTVALATSLDKDASISIIPQVVKATLDVRPPNITSRIPSMPVFVTAPSAFSEAFKLQGLDPIITNVTITGPPDKVEAINKPNFTPQPKARLEITIDDQKEGSYERQLVFDLPPGVQVSKEDQERRVSFNVVKLMQPQ